jgi:PEP-CTERM motif-containing protein
VTVSGASYSQSYEPCADNVGGPCGYYSGGQSKGLNSLGGGNSILVSDQSRFISFGSTGFALQQDINFNVTGADVPGGLASYFALDFTLPDGLSVAAVPEPSTWAMLLIGFASVGFLSCMKSRREDWRFL